VVRWRWAWVVVVGRLVFERVAGVGVFCGGFGMEADNLGRRAKI
jgi:hypothetical protein